MRSVQFWSLNVKEFIVKQSVDGKTVIAQPAWYKHPVFFILLPMPLILGLFYLNKGMAGVPFVVGSFVFNILIAMLVRAGKYTVSHDELVVKYFGKVKRFDITPHTEFMRYGGPFNNSSRFIVIDTETRKHLKVETRTAFDRKYMHGPLQEALKELGMPVRDLNEEYRQHMAREDVLEDPIGFVDPDTYVRVKYPEM